MHPRFIKCATKLTPSDYCRTPQHIPSLIPLARTTSFLSLYRVANIGTRSSRSVRGCKNCGNFTDCLHRKILSTCGVSGHGALRNALEQDENYVSVLMREVLSSAENITSVRSLDPQGAEQFMVLLQDVSSISTRSWIEDSQMVS
jgi:hypothetical protein